jgi:hypothetical protein
MKISCVIGLVLLISVSGEVRSEFSLQGKWRSNSELTIQSIESVRDLSKESREAYERMFGKMILAFSGNGVEVDRKIPGAERLSYTYRIISKSPDRITVEYGGPDDPEETVDYVIEGPCIKRKVPGEEWFEYWCKVE